MCFSAFAISCASRWGEHSILFLAFIYICFCVSSFALILFGNEVGKRADRRLIKSTIEAKERFAAQNPLDGRAWDDKCFDFCELRAIKRSILFRHTILYGVVFFLLMLIFMWRLSTSDDGGTESTVQENSHVTYCSDDSTSDYNNSNVEHSSSEDRYIAHCYFCGAGITNAEAYSYQYIDGHEAYKCESCLNKYKSSPSNYSNIEVPSDGFQDDGYIHVYLVGEGETVSVKNSSWITAITYYPDCGHLIITSGSKRYAFANVSESTWNSFKAAPSKGSFYNSTFKGDSQYWVDDYDGTNGNLIRIEEWNPEY